MAFPAEESADRPRPPQETASPLRAGNDEDIYCPHCGYNLRGLTSGRCPECGNVCDLATMSRSLIPWLHRAEVRRVRAWWQTCWMALRRPGQFAASINAPCPYTEARRFWLINVAIVCLPLVVLCGMFALSFTAKQVPTGPLAMSLSGGRNDSWLAVNAAVPWMSAVIYWPVVAIAGGLTVLLVTGGVSYLFQVMPIPRRQQDRSAAMSLYSSGAMIAGALVLLCLAVVVGLAWMAVRVSVGLPLNPSAVGFTAISVLGAASTLAPLIWFAAVLTLYRRICHASLTRSVVVGVLLLLAGILSLAVACGLIPWCIGLLRVILMSL